MTKESSRSISISLDTACFPYNFMHFYGLVVTISSVGEERRISIRQYSLSDSYKNAQSCQASYVCPKREAVVHQSHWISTTSHITLCICTINFSRRIIIKLQFFKLQTPTTPTHSISFHALPPPPCRHSPPPTHQKTSSTRNPRPTPWYRGYTPYHGVPDPPPLPPAPHHPGTLKEERGPEKERPGRRQGAGGQTGTRGCRARSPSQGQWGRRERSQRC